jgi:Protein of unknown function (DUF2612)
MSNGIGQFVIGESTIGNAPYPWRNTLYSQYANSPIIGSLLDYFSQWIDANQSVDSFYDDVWNIETAKGYGLAVWGRIVGINSNVIQISDVPYTTTNESGGNAVPTGFSTLYSGEPTTSNYALSDDAFRALIMAKAAANIWDGSILGLNNILRLLFPSLVSYVTDGLDMTMTYTFTWQLTPVQAALVMTENVLPRPCGVSTTIVQLI